MRSRICPTPQQKNTVITVDKTTHEKLKFISEENNNRPLKRIVDEMATMLSVMLDFEKTNTQQVADLRRLMATASDGIARNDDMKQTGISVRKPNAEIMRSVKNLYDITYNQLIQAVIPYYSTVRVIGISEIADLNEIAGYLYKVPEGERDMITGLMKQYEHTRMRALLSQVRNQLPDVEVALWGKLDDALTAVYESTGDEDDTEDEYSFI